MQRLEPLGQGEACGFGWHLMSVTSTQQVNIGGTPSCTEGLELQVLGSTYCTPHVHCACQPEKSLSLSLSAFPASPTNPTGSQLAMLCTACWQDVDAVVETCHEAGISRKAVRLRPVAVVKG